MTFVTVGNGLHGFDRLMKTVEEMKLASLLDGEVIVQYGHSGIVPRGCTCVPFVTREEFNRLIRDASMVIAHAGGGTVGKCLLMGKKPVVVPRRKKFGEVVNDHQLDLVRELESRGRIYAAHDVAGLSDVVRFAMQQGTTQNPSSGNSEILNIVKHYFDALLEEKGIGLRRTPH